MPNLVNHPHSFQQKKKSRKQWKWWSISLMTDLVFLVNFVFLFLFVSEIAYFIESHIKYFVIFGWVESYAAKEFKRKTKKRNGKKVVHKPFQQIPNWMKGTTISTRLVAGYSLVRNSSTNWLLIFFCRCLQSIKIWNLRTKKKFKHFCMLSTHFFVSIDSVFFSSVRSRKLRRKQSENVMCVFALIASWNERWTETNSK